MSVSQRVAAIYIRCCGCDHRQREGLRSRTEERGNGLDSITHRAGLIGAALYYGKSRGGFFGEAIYKQIGGWAIGIILFGFLMPQINNSAHIGGMVFGGLTAMILGYSEKIRETLTHRVLAGVCMITTLLVLLYALFRGLMFGLGG